MYLVLFGPLLAQTNCTKRKKELQCLSAKLNDAGVKAPLDKKLKGYNLRAIYKAI